MRKFKGSRDGEDGVVKRKGGINGGRWGVLGIGEREGIIYANIIGNGIRLRFMGRGVSGRGGEDRWKVSGRIKVEGRGIMYRVTI